MYGVWLHGLGPLGGERGEGGAGSLAFKGTGTQNRFIWWGGVFDRVKRVLFEMILVVF